MSNLITIAAIEVKTGNAVKLFTWNTDVKPVESGIRAAAQDAKDFGVADKLTGFFATTETLPEFEF